MKRILLLFSSIYIIGIVASWLAFLVVFRVLYPNPLPMSFDTLWMSFGLCLLVFTVRGLFIVVPIAILIAFFPTIRAVVVSFLFACAASWFFVGGSDSRDRSLAIAGAIGYALATLVMQQFISRRRHTSH